MTPIEIGQAVAVVVVTAIMAIDKLRERRAKKKGLPGNPERCQKMADRMTKVEKDIEYMREDVQEIKEKIG